MRASFRRAISLTLVCLLSSCTSVGATKRGAVSFNRVFAEARNEILLLNILRASVSEPQQFSTVSTVTGNMRPEIKITGGLDNLILGAAKVFDPGSELTLRNPSVTIAPLESKEFRQGMMKPVDAAFVDELLHEGWAHDVVLHLVLAGVKCSDSVTYWNRSAADTERQRVLTFAKGGQWRSVDDGEAKEFGAPIVVPSEDAAKMLHDGVGKGLKVVVVEPVKTDPPGSVRLQFKKEGSSAIRLTKPFDICSSVPTTKPEKAAEDPLLLDPDKLVFRSPGAMIQYLGTLATPGLGNEFFKVEKAESKVPIEALVGTRFRGNLFYVSHGKGCAEQSVECDRSRETLALLAEIIGFQTTDATLNASKPTLTVSN